MLVNKCRIFDEDNRAKYSYYKNLSVKKGKGQFRGNSYITHADKGKQEATYEEKPSGGGAPTSVQCYRYGVISHRANECFSVEKKFYKCGKA